MTEQERHRDLAIDVLRDFTCAPKRSVGPINRLSDRGVPLRSGPRERFLVVDSEKEPTLVEDEEQTQNLSLTTQRRECRAYCRREGFDVLGEFTDAGESAKTTDRPEFQKLLQYCRDNKGKLQLVVVYNSARSNVSPEEPPGG